MDPEMLTRTEDTTRQNLPIDRRWGENEKKKKSVSLLLPPVDRPKFSRPFPSTGRDTAGLTRGHSPAVRRIVRGADCQRTAIPLLGQ